MAIGLGALGCGLCFGAAAVALALFVRNVTGFADASGNGLLAGLALGIAVAAMSSWRLSRPLDDMWQRGVVSILAVFGALMIVFLFTFPAHQLLGSAGLLILAAVLFVGGMAAGRWAVRGRGTDSEGT